MTWTILLFILDTALEEEEEQARGELDFEGNERTREYLARTKDRHRQTRDHGQEGLKGPLNVLNSRPGYNH